VAAKRSSEHAALRVMLAGGGTGGHITPALAFGEALQQRYPQALLWYCGRPGSLEQTLVRQHGWAFKTVCSAPPRPGFARCWALARIAWGLLQSVMLVLRFRPRLVVGFGGYTAFPLLLAALWLRRPVLVHEANALPGRAVRALARRGAWVAYGLSSDDADDALHALARQLGTRARRTGNPLRRAFLDATIEHACRVTGLAADAPTVLVLGGSLGSRALNTLAPPALEHVARAVPRLQIVHIAGIADVERVRRVYAQTALPHYVAGFSNEMGALFRLANLVLARAGALTLSEICACGLPAVLIPYPFAADRHQEFNARVLSSRGAAILLNEADATPALLAAHIQRILTGPDAAAMAAAARGLAMPDAAEQLVAFADVCMTTS